MALGPLLLMVAVVVYGPTPATAAAHPAPARTDRSPVNLATPVDMADGLAHPSAIVRSGDARIEVLSPTLLRLEYSPSGRFENSPTVNAIDRRMPVPPYSARVAGGWLTVRTSRATVRYKVGSGPFTPVNTSLHFTDGDAVSTVHPTWDWECPFDQTCQSGAAHLSGEAAIGQGTNGYESSAGFVGYLFHPGDAATWNVLGAPAGSASVSLRYSNTFDPLAAPGSHTLALVVNGQPVRTLVAAQTERGRPVGHPHHHGGAPGWAPTRWRWPARPATPATSNSTPSPSARPRRRPRCRRRRSLSAVGSGVSTPSPTTPAATCAPRAPPGPPARSPSSRCTPTDSSTRPGYRLLDDTQSAPWTGQGWVEPRPAGGDVEDGYLFVYGHDYTGALRTFAQLTGPAPLLPRNVFGVWYSDYTPYSSSDIENSIYPAFQANDVPLNTLSLDTDWKAPNDWDGWEWNNALFPDPTVVPGLGQCPRHRRHLEHPLEHRRPRPQAAHGRERGRELPGLVDLFGRSLQGVGLEHRLAGRVQLRSPTELPEAGSGFLVAGLVL